MVGRPNWFSRRKYGGWGIRPQTWQGWLYIALIIIPFVIFQSLPHWSAQIRLAVTLFWLSFLLLDITHIMVTLHRDEREHKIESLAERNSAWVMVLVLVAGILCQIFASIQAQSLQLDWFLVIALFSGMITKTISNLILERKSI